MLTDPSTEQPSPLRPVRFFGGLLLVTPAVQPGTHHSTANVGARDDAAHGIVPQQRFAGLNPYSRLHLPPGGGGR